MKTEILDILQFTHPEFAETVTLVKLTIWPKGHQKKITGVLRLRPDLVTESLPGEIDCTAALEVALVDYQKKRIPLLRDDLCDLCLDFAFVQLPFLYTIDLAGTLWGDVILAELKPTERVSRKEVLERLRLRVHLDCAKTYSEKNKFEQRVKFYHLRTRFAKKQLLLLVRRAMRKMNVTDVVISLHGRDLVLRFPAHKYK